MESPNNCLYSGQDRESAEYAGDAMLEVDQSYLQEKMNPSAKSPRANMGRFANAYQAFMPESSSIFTAQKEKYEKLAGVSASGSINMKDATYLNPLKRENQEDEKTVVDQLQSDQNASAESRANEAAVVVNTTSPEDYRKVEEAGFSVTESDSRTIITVTDKIKAVLAEAGVDVSIYGDALTKEQLEDITGSPVVVDRIVRALEANDLPATEENVQESVTALEEVFGLSGLSEDAIVYLLKNALEPTVRNVYTAEYTGLAGLGEPEYAMPQADLDALEGQIAGIIEEAGLEVTDAAMEQSKWLISHHIPLTSENLVYLGQLRDLSGRLEEGTLDWNEVIDSMAKAISSGKRPENGYLITARRKLEETRLAMTTEASRAMLRRGMEIDTKPLEELVEDLKEQERQYYRTLLVSVGVEATDGNVDTLSETLSVFDEMKKEPAYVLGRLGSEATIEEIHESGRALQSEFEKAGVGYETLMRGADVSGRDGVYDAELASAIQNMAAAESGRAGAESASAVQNMDAAASGREGVRGAASYVQNTDAAVPDRAGIYGVESASYVQNMDAAASGREGVRGAASYVRNMNADVSGTADGQRSVRPDEYQRANERYETLMTAPRSDMGDSIRKAFRNVDDILTDMKLDTSDANRRAVRILAYNEMPVTQENISSVKAMDGEMQRAFKNMNPAVTLEMIRRGENPLDLTVEELNHAAEQIKEETGSEEQERFNKYLWKLEQNHEISEEERSSYIGIYRLIAQVEKTDGAALGSLLNQGSDITMRNLLTAMRSARKKSMDYKVDDDFAGAKSRAAGPRIDEQIEAGFQQNCLKDVLDEITPEKMAKLGADWEQMTPEQLAEALKEMETSEQEQQAEEAYVREQLDACRQVLETSKDVYSYLERYDIGNSVTNILAASELLRSPNQMMERLWKKGAFSKNSMEMIRNLKNQVLEEFGEALKNPEALADAQETLADVAEHVMDTMLVEDPSVRALDVRELRQMTSQFKLCAKKAQEESYMVPVQTGDSVTGVSLKIVRGKEKKGTVDILFHSDRMGSVAATFQAKEKGISGMIAVNDENTRELLAENVGLLASAMQDTAEEPEAVQINVAYTPALSLERYEMTGLQREEKMRKAGELAEENSERSPVQTARLYHIAESFIQSVQDLLN